MVRICLNGLKRLGLLGLLGFATLNPTYGVAIKQSAPFSLIQQRPVLFGAPHTGLPFCHVPDIRGYWVELFKVEFGIVSGRQR